MKVEIGSKLVCIDGDFSKNKYHPKDYFNDIPIEGKIYVVREIDSAANGEIGFKLVGIYGKDESYVFRPKRFRLLDELKKQKKKGIKELSMEECLLLVSILQKEKDKNA